jgi:hypothetical protein
MNAYEEKLERRRERLEAKSARLSREGNAKVESGMERLRAIPFGQPILIGHHSENRDRNYRRKAGAAIDRGMEMRQQADEIAARAASVGLGGISSDDPDAPEKLREKLAKLEADQERMKAENAAWRKAGNKAGRQPDGSWVDSPNASFTLTNLSARIRSTKDRIAALERASNRETKEVLHNSGVKLVQNTELNRVQLLFSGKPSEETRALLKHHGFRWAPSVKAWQRQLNNSGIYAAQCVLEKLTD